MEIIRVVCEKMWISFLIGLFLKHSATITCLRIFSTTWLFLPTQVGKLHTQRSMQPTGWCVLWAKVKCQNNVDNSSYCNNCCIKKWIREHGLSCWIILYFFVSDMNALNFHNQQDNSTLKQTNEKIHWMSQIHFNYWENYKKKILSQQRQEITSILGDILSLSIFFAALWLKLT